MDLLKLHISVLYYIVLLCLYLLLLSMLLLCLFPLCGVGRKCDETYFPGRSKTGNKEDLHKMREVFIRNMFKLMKMSSI